MTPELIALTLAALLQAVQFALFAIPANLELTPKYTCGPRDDAPPRPLSVRTARLQRALNNHFESLILFTIAVLVVTLGSKSTALTQYAAYIYLVARVFYVPAYVLGWVPGRTVIWAVGFIASLTMLVAALL